MGGFRNNRQLRLPIPLNSTMPRKKGKDVPVSHLRPCAGCLADPKRQRNPVLVQPGRQCPLCWARLASVKG